MEKGFCQSIFVGRVPYIRIPLKISRQPKIGKQGTEVAVKVTVKDGWK